MRIQNIEATKRDIARLRESAKSWDRTARNSFEHECCDYGHFCRCMAARARREADTLESMI